MGFIFCCPNPVGSTIIIIITGQNVLVVPDSADNKILMIAIKMMFPFSVIYHEGSQILISFSLTNE